MRPREVLVTTVRALFGLSLTEPLSLVVTHYDSLKVLHWGVVACVVRLIGSPFVLGALAVSWLVARERGVGRLLLLAAVIEGVTFATGVVLFLRFVA